MAASAVILNIVIILKLNSDLVMVTGCKQTLRQLVATVILNLR